MAIHGFLPEVAKHGVQLIKKLLFPVVIESVISGADKVINLNFLKSITFGGALNCFRKSNTYS